MLHDRMIRPWVLVLTGFHHTPLFGRVWLLVAILGLYAALVALLHRVHLVTGTLIGAQFHGFLGLVLGALLVFRTNTSYDRWWEGRKLWGQLVNDSRNLAIKVQACVRADRADKQRLARWLADFAYALKEHLREGVQLADLSGFANERVQPPPGHVPAYIATRIYQQLEAWRQRTQLGEIELLFLDRHVAALMDICGACERIKKTPISVSYRWFVRQSIAIYLLALPWGLMETFGLWMVPAVAMIGYFIVGVEIIAEQIEDPFGRDEDDLRLDDICRTIEQNVLEIAGSSRTESVPEAIDML